MGQIGVVADTHLAGSGVELPRALLEAFAAVSAIIHAGDSVSLEVLDRLRQIAPVHAVYGNVDPFELQRTLPDKVVVDFEGMRVGVTHGHLGEGRTTPERAVRYLTPDAPLHAVVFGHSHIPLIEQRNGVLLFNPGSPTQPRRQPRRSCGLLIVEEGRLRAEHIFL